MKKDVVKKIEEEIKSKTTLPENIKEKIRKEIFVNIIIAIGLVVYFTFLILASKGTNKIIDSIDFNIFSMITLGIAIYLFEISYKKDNDKLAMFGIETLVIAIFTLFLPYIVFELDQMHKKYYLIISGYVALYYIIKCIYISLKIKKKYITELSDIKDIVKKEKRKIVEPINQEETYKKKNDKKEQNNNVKKTENKKISSEKNKKSNSKEKSKDIKDSANKKKTNEIAKNTVASNTTKKRGRPKKEETLKKETDKKVQEAPKKRGRPKKEETLKKEMEKQVENAPKKRGRPRKVVTSND